MPDPARVLRRRRSPLALALGAVRVALVVVVEVLIFDAYANVNRTTAIFREQSFLKRAEFAGDIVQRVPFRLTQVVGQRQQSA